MAADFNTIARPYARAVFDLAYRNGQLDAWGEAVGLLGAIAADDRVNALLASPKLAPEQAVSLILDIAGDRLGEQARNVVQLLADNRRLLALPALARQYETLRQDAENTLDATVVAAREVDDTLREQLATALGKRLGRTVRLTSEIDERLLGGAIIRAGDLVIDGSVRGRLDRLATVLNR